MGRILSDVLKKESLVSILADAKDRGHELKHIHALRPLTLYVTYLPLEEPALMLTLHHPNDSAPWKDCKVTVLALAETQHFAYKFEHTSIWKKDEGF